MSSISGINNGIMGKIMTQGENSRPDPAEKFKELDADSNGGLDKTELSVLAKELSKMAGKSLDVDASITSYDTGGDGMLSQEEMDTMMKETMGPPPGGGASGSLSVNTDEDQLAVLLEMLEQMTNSSSSANAPPDPAEKFKELDSDSSGGLNQTELDVMAGDLSALTGKTVDMSEAITTYDADQNGELSQDEVDTMMQENIGPPPAKSGTVGGTSAQQASNAYLANAGDDRLDLLRQLLEKMRSDSSTDSGTTTISVT